MLESVFLGYMFPSWIPAFQWAASYSPWFSCQVQTPELPHRWAGRQLPQETLLAGTQATNRWTMQGPVSRRRREPAGVGPQECEQAPGWCQCCWPGVCPLKSKGQEEAGLARLGLGGASGLSRAQAWPLEGETQWSPPSLAQLPQAHRDVSTCCVTLFKPLFHSESQFLRQ